MAALGSYAQKADTLQSIQSHMKQADEAEKKRRDAEIDILLGLKAEDSYRG